ncbi:hypothetical protein FOZ61_001140 [Perkinsus olseni]|uniref:Uncharacterized protein n=1 Tax=Perkinsus olseni TaxID=32597 RepID=A0A7J6KR27_PEROL|nr:hypothetical protein FOZ61_001140 [Perkinsus olseni]KAF4650336.1 hypothetical protein FOL46_001023 [Perkinsus olseni]
MVSSPYIPKGINVNGGKYIASIYVKDGAIGKYVRVYGALRGQLASAIEDRRLLEKAKEDGTTLEDMREMVSARRKQPKMPSNITKNRGGYVRRILKTVNGEKRTIYGSWCTGVDEAWAQREALLEARERGASYDRLVELVTSFKAPRFRDAAAAAQVNEATSRRLEKGSPDQGPKRRRRQVA